MQTAWMIPFILLGGALQTCGAAMNGQLNKSMVNPWLASAVSFALITFFFIAMFLVLPHPLPTSRDLAAMPWWAVLGGLVGAVQVFAGLTLVSRVRHRFVCGVDCHCRPPHVAGGRPLRMVSHGSAPVECLASARRPAARGRRDADLEVLKAATLGSVRAKSLRTPRFLRLCEKELPLIEDKIC